MHSGPWQETLEKRTPEAATLWSPAHPSMSARCWSDITTTMLGALVTTPRLPRPAGHAHQHGFAAPWAAPRPHSLQEGPGVPGRPAPSGVADRHAAVDHDDGPGHVARRRQ